MSKMPVMLFHTAVDEVLELTSPWVVATARTFAPVTGSPVASLK